MIIFLLLIPLPCLSVAAVESLSSWQFMCTAQYQGTCRISRNLLSKQKLYSIWSFNLVHCLLFLRLQKNITRFGMLLLINFIPHICLQYQYALPKKRVLHSISWQSKHLSKLWGTLMLEIKIMLFSKKMVGVYLVSLI